ncbi:MAG: hypothetical protein ACPL2D_08480 [Ignavibacteria bacterium]
MRQSLKYVAVAIGIIILLFLNQFLRRKFDRHNYYVIRDTSLLSTVEKNLKRDTVIRVYEKIIYRQMKPKEVYVDRPDSAGLEKWKKMDLMLRLQKKHDELSITALNQQDSLIKEFRFGGVPDNFTVTAKAGDVFVKMSRFQWEGIETGIEVRKDIFSDRKLSADFLLSSEVLIIGRIGIGCVIRYPLVELNSNKLEVGINLNYKIK